MNLVLAKDVLAKVMRRYPQLGMVKPTKGGIKYGGGKLVPDSQVFKILGELYGK